MIFEGKISVQEIIHYLHTDSYLTKRQAAEYLKLSVRTLEDRKDIPRFKYQPEGNRRKYSKQLFKRSELDRWMERFRIRIPANPLTKDERPGGDPARVADEIVRELLA